MECVCMDFSCHIHRIIKNEYQFSMAIRRVRLANIKYPELYRLYVERDRHSSFPHGQSGFKQQKETSYEGDDEKKSKVFLDVGAHAITSFLHDSQIFQN